MGEGIPTDTHQVPSIQISVPRLFSQVPSIQISVPRSLSQCRGYSLSALRSKPDLGRYESARKCSIQSQCNSTALHINITISFQIPHSPFKSINFLSNHPPLSKYRLNQCISTLILTEKHPSPVWGRNPPTYIRGVTRIPPPRATNATLRLNSVLPWDFRIFI